MKAQFNIPQLVALASNINYQPIVAGAVTRLLYARNENDFNVALKEATDAVLGFESIDGYSIKDYGSNPKAQFAGLPIFQPLTISDGKDEFLLQSAVCSVSRTKNIVITAVQGRDTSVKEFINNGDFTISISGIISTPGWQYPLEDVIIFNQFMEKKMPLKVNHELLNNLGIFEVVVTDYSIPKTPHINCQAYSFNCINDEPLPLTISDLPTNLAL